MPSLMKTLGAATGALTLSLVSSGVALAVSAPTQTASPQDNTFVMSNAQANLAEIALGKLGLQKGMDAATKQLAQVTMADHTKLQAQLATVAAADNITLPSKPNAMQQATAAQLAATPATSFDLAYAQAEVAGHQMAIAGAKTEVANGAAANVKAYATGYIPIATMHLNMATAEVNALSGAAPMSVSAGTGGLATTDTSHEGAWLIGIGAGLALVAGSGTVLVYRRRQSYQAV